MRHRFGRLAALVAGLAMTASALAVPVAGAPSASAGNPSWLHTSGSRIVTESGEDFTIKAVNWFGMETPNCAPHGLWQISLDQAMDQIASFGFNAIRLPFSSECLAGTVASVSGVDRQVNPGLQGLTPLQIMDRVVEAAAARNLRVVLDRHRPDSGGQSELWFTDRYPEQRWIDDWVALAARYRDRPTVIGADLHNEPHGAACWGCGDPAVDWAAAATRAGNAILAVNPRWLIIVEGVERQSTAGPTWWGGGLADVAAHPLTLAVPNQLVYSAHDYPASIYQQSWFSDATFPANLAGVWDRNWGYLQRQDLAPVFLGEFGTKLESPSDAAWLQTLVRYLGANHMGFAYWSYNPDSGDTGGLVADDWRTPQQRKLNVLAPLLGVAASSATPPSGTATPSTATPSTATPSTATPSAAASSALPSTTPSPKAGGSGVTVSWRLQSSWSNGYVAQLVVSAPGNPAEGWSVSWPDPHATGVSGAWGMACTLDAGVIRCDGADWAARIPAGGSATVGLQVDNDGTAPTAPPVTVR